MYESRHLAGIAGPLNIALAKNDLKDDSRSL